MDYVLQGLERGPASSGGGVEEATGDGGLSGCGGEWVGPSQREGSPVPPARCSGGGGGLSGERDTDTSSEEGEEEIIPSVSLATYAVCLRVHVYCIIIQSCTFMFVRMYGI